MSYSEQVTLRHDRQAVSSVVRTGGWGPSEPGLGLEGERGSTICPWRVVAVGQMVVIVSAVLPIVKGVLVAILPVGMLSTLIVRGSSPWDAGYFDCQGQKQNGEVWLGWVLKQVGDHQSAP